MSEPQEIHAFLKRYEEALNQSDTSAVMKSYGGVFDAIRLTVSFAVTEVVQVAPDWAFARTNSEGTVLVHATGQAAAEANQELFVLQRINGEWKIARYCFSTTNPPRE